MRRVLFVLMLLVAGCVETGRSYVSVPVAGAGTGQREVSVDGWTLEILRADVAFGPFYGCATASASPEFCEEALLELTEAVTVDGLAEEPAVLADAHGITGTVRSAMWDHGHVWLSTAPRPQVLEGAVEGARSARFEVRMTHGDGRIVRVLADLDVVPRAAGVISVRGRRLEEHELAPGDRMLVRVDPAAWWGRIDPERIAAAAVEGEVVLEEGDADHEALLVAITAGAPATIEWDF